VASRWSRFLQRSTCFRRFFRPSSGARNCTYSVRYFSDQCCYPLLAWQKRAAFVDETNNKFIVVDGLRLPVFLCDVPQRGELYKENPFWYQWVRDVLFWDQGERKVPLYVRVRKVSLRPRDTATENSFRNISLHNNSLHNLSLHVSCLWCSVPVAVGCNVADGLAYALPAQWSVRRSLDRGTLITNFAHLKVSRLLSLCFAGS